MLAKHHVSQFYGAEEAVNKATSAVRALPLTEGFANDLAFAVSVLQEVRHFASCMHDSVENIISSAVTVEQAEEAEAIRRQLCERLIAFCSPKV